MAGLFVRKCPCLRPPIDDDIRVLDYRHCSLTDVPGEVFNFERTLEELYADSNQIRDLPRELFYCHGLRKLSISDNEIKSIPPAISSLASLEELDFSKNGIIDVPDNIKACKYLRSIEASVNPLGKLPEGFTQLQNLTSLFLNDTFLDFLPGSFGRLVHLKILEIRENHLKTLPNSFSRLADLERLDIGNNEFTELPDVVGNLTTLLELWCDNNQIKRVTSKIGRLNQLIFFDASKNVIEHLPREIEGCVSLADLHLTTNNLSELPDSVGNLNNLTTLKVDDNQLTALPKTIGGLSALSELNVSANDIEALPASIGLLRNLRTFYADENFLEFLPADIGSCNGITVLSLRSNKLTYIPDEIGRIPRLRVLNLSDNRLQHLPFSVIKLKELQALWLTENQTRPLIPLQSDYDPETNSNRKILTCYLLPQTQQHDDEGGGGGDTDSFHASMWDEERARRQQIHFEFGDEVDEEGHLYRCPTPYPKEMREKARHARNLAMRQTMGEDGSQWEQGMENLGYESEEKQQKDKARMQQHRQSQEVEDETMSLLTPKPQKKEKRDDNGGFSQSRPQLVRGSGSSPNIPADVADGRYKPDMPKSKSHFGIYGTDTPYVMQSHSSHGHRHHGSRGKQSHRMRDYDSDTGYRSDHELLKFRKQVLSDGRGSGPPSVSSSTLSHNHRHQHHHHHHHQQRPRPRREGGYASDLEAYSGRGRDWSQKSATLSYQHPAHSLPYDLHNQVSKTNSDSATVPHSRRIMMKNDELFNQTSSQESVKNTTLSPLKPLPTPSPSLFQRNKFVDQSTPVALEPPESFPPTVQDGSMTTSASDTSQGKDFQRELYTVLEERIQRQNGDVSKSMPQQRPSSELQMMKPPSFKPPPPYRRTPERTSSTSSGDRSYTESPRPGLDSPRPKLDSPRDCPSRLSDPIRQMPDNISRHKDYETWTLDRTQSSEGNRTPKVTRNVYHDNQSEGDKRKTASYLSDRYDLKGTSQEDVFFRDRPGSRAEKTDKLDKQLTIDVGNVSFQSDRSHPVRRHSDPYRERPRSRTFEHSDSQRMYDSYTYPDCEPDESLVPMMTKYEDVEKFKTSDPSSQVSSSTDSGYGHSHPIYDRVGDFSRHSGHSGSQPPPSPQVHHSLIRQGSSASRDAYMSGQSREGTPVRDDSGYPKADNSVDNSYQEIRETFRVKITKNPGLGFSVAGGLGSHGNPYRPNDKGIFITKIQPEGPAAKTLRPGDKIMEVNGMDFRNVDHNQAVSVMKNNTSVALLVERLQKVNIV
ncbi:leucine-rich repeat-containing protein 7-like isoform X2 [Haliotis cracherodii]|uniref:leucine-rich repeat-containing protein 7-like isoform X2 n=1 Tax=Haliotis cracherodii TaxID=6455 RepID=UPI0039E9DD99